MNNGLKLKVGDDTIEQGIVDIKESYSMNKKQKIKCNKWERLERQNVGKRKFEILRRATFEQGSDPV